tara:strand:+ start:657 stop:827 length:171 start_codon:yes stop_codon:yes gene_type:complete
LLLLLLDKDTTETILANAGALSLSLTNINEWLQVLSMAAAFIFTVIKIVKEFKKWK